MREKKYIENLMGEVVYAIQCLDITLQDLKNFFRYTYARQGRTEKEIPYTFINDGAFVFYHEGRPYLIRKGDWLVYEFGGFETYTHTYFQCYYTLIEEEEE